MSNQAKYILKAGLFWGFFMFLFGHVILGLADGNSMELMDMKKFFYWLGSGLLFGVVMWYAEGKKTNGVINTKYAIVSPKIRNILKIGLMWGLLSFVIFYLFECIVKGKFIEYYSFIELIIFLIVGIFFGLGMNCLIEKKKDKK